MVPGVLGGLYVETGEIDKAFELLQPLADSPTANAAVLYNAGRAAIGRGDVERAIRYLRRSVQIEPVSPAARRLGLLLGSQGRFADAYPHLSSWVRSNPDDAEARLAAAFGAVRLERVPEAEELLSELDQQDPGVKLLWGQLLEIKGDLWGAVSHLKPLVEDAPPGLQNNVRRLLARVYLAVGESASAMGLLEGHVGDDPHMALELSRAQYQSGQLEMALETLEPFAAPLLGDETRRQHLAADLLASLSLEYGRLLVTAGRHREAIPHLELNTGIDPASKLGWQSLGQALAADGRREEALRALERFTEISEQEEKVSLNQLERDLEDPTGRELREAMALLEQGKGDEALRRIRREAELAPDDLRPRLLEIRALLLLEKPEVALEVGRILLSGSPDNPDALYVVATVRMALQQLVEAEEDLRRALEISPRYTPAMNDLAVLLMGSGREEEAEGLLERVLELRPGDPLARANLESLR